MSCVCVHGNSALLRADHNQPEQVTKRHSIRASSRCTLITQDMIAAVDVNMHSSAAGFAFTFGGFPKLQLHA